MATPERQWYRVRFLRGDEEYWETAVDLTSAFATSAARPDGATDRVLDLRDHPDDPDVRPGVFDWSEVSGVFPVGRERAEAVARERWRGKQAPRRPLVE